MCKILILNILIRPAGRVAVSPDLPTLQKKCFESSCVLCSAVAYCCGAVAPRAIAALLGRFLPRLGPLVHSSGPFFFGLDFIVRHSGAREARALMCNCTSKNLFLLLSCGLMDSQMCNCTS